MTGRWGELELRTMNRRKTLWLTGMALTLSMGLSASVMAQSEGKGAARPADAAGMAPMAAESGFTVGDEGHRFDSTQAKGSLIAVHFLLGDECPFCMKLLNEYTASAASVAGVRHVFVQNISKEAFEKKLATLPEDQKASLFRDVDGALSKRFNVKGGYQFHGMVMNYPALVLVNDSGKELYRYTGTSNADRLKFTDFSKKVAELTRDDSAKEANLEDGVALAGYDAVQYIDGNKAVKGETTFTSAYKGVSYRFASKATLEKFAADPEKYVPAYGGWCGTAMAEGKKVEVDPKNFKVVGGKTVLFYNGFWGDALKDWNKDEKGLKPKADEKWNELTHAKKKGG